MSEIDYKGKIETPYDLPASLTDRMTYPSLREAFLRGWQAGSRQAIDNLADIGWEFAEPDETGVEYGPDDIADGRQF
jgi:hypothetical protein